MMEVVPLGPHLILIVSRSLWPLKKLPSRVREMGGVGGGEGREGGEGRDTTTYCHSAITHLTPFIPLIWEQPSQTDSRKEEK